MYILESCGSRWTFLVVSWHVNGASGFTNTHQVLFRRISTLQNGERKGRHYGRSNWSCYYLHIRHPPGLWIWYWHDECHYSRSWQSVRHESLTDTYVGVCIMVVAFTVATEYIDYITAVMERLPNILFAHVYVSFVFYRKHFCYFFVFSYCEIANANRGECQVSKHEVSITLYSRFQQFSKPVFESGTGYNL